MNHLRPRRIAFFLAVYIALPTQPVLLASGGPAGLPQAAAAWQRAGEILERTDGVLRSFCAASDGTAHPKKVTLLQPVSIDRFAAASQLRVLFVYSADNGGSDSRGKITATVRRIAGEGGARDKLGRVKAQQNPGNGEAFGEEFFAAAVQEGDTIEWSVAFQKMGALDTDECFTFIALIATVEDECTGYGAWRSSPYTLPYAPGVESVVTQGNCYIGSHRGQARYAYDFGLARGSSIVAARAGEVVGVEVEHPDDTGRADDDNVITILQDDGSYARYVHLQQDSALVAVGARVEAGDPLALSGNSGSTSGVPHLHFQVTPCTDRDLCGTLPVTFRNTRANPTGPKIGGAYKAKSF